MSEKIKQDYSIGLDLGTNSVGYAVLNPDFSLVKKSGKHLWGVDLFDAGKTAVDTRKFRAARRHYERRKERIRLLQMLMANEVNSVDPQFFARLSNSFLLHHNNDAEFGRDNLCNLFDGDYNDSEYYNQFKTIYHLRRELCENKEKADIRLVYLALHHLIKYRGNFLRDGDSFSKKSISLETDLEGFIDKYKDFFIDSDGVIDSIIPLMDTGEVVKILTNTTYKKKDKRDKVRALFNDAKYKKQVDAFVSAILGYTTNISDLFPNDEDSQEKSEKLKISFDDADYDMRSMEFPSILGDEKTELVEMLHDFYSSLTLTLMLGEGNDRVYQCMIERFDKNKIDLKMLKEALKPNEELYEKFFGENCADKSFVTYFRPNVKGKNRCLKKRCTRKDFYKECENVLKKMPDSEAKEYCLKEIENDDFLIKLNSTFNSVFPYQLNLTELEIIIDNQGVYYPELKENKEKIKSILTFKRPYSVGVINPESRFSWITNEDFLKQERAYPWNFNEVVNVASASQKFMEKLINKDEYFNEPVLPKDSVIYQMYNVLNELANVKLIFVNGSSRQLTVKEKTFALYRLFIENRSANEKALIKLIEEFSNEKPESVSGFTDPEAKKFVSKMSSYRMLRPILGDCIFYDAGEITFDYDLLENFERVILVLSIYNDIDIQKDTLKKDGFDADTINKLIKCKFSGWGRLSKKCLLGVKGADDLSIIETMLTTEHNFNKILYSEELGFKEQFLHKDDKSIDKVSYSLVDDLRISPESKRTVWQALKVVKEIEKIMGNAPRSIYVESTRTDDKKKVTKKRVDQLKELFGDKKAEAIAENNGYLDDFKAMKKLLSTKNPEAFDEEKLYLYIKQLGKSLYSGKPINLECLSEYEVDHIVPRHYIKDDSLSNKALVTKEENQEKSGTLALNYAIRQKMTPFWQMLYKCNLMEKKKYYALIKEEYSERDVNGFINRQLVDTGIVVKNVRTLLSSIYPESDIDFVKPVMANLFRSYHMSNGYYEFCKLRDLNDFHHAKDAYLTAAIGVFTRKVYPIWGANEASRDIRDELSMNKDPAKVRDLVQKRYGFVVDAMIHSNPSGHYNVDWNVCYNNILKCMNYNDCLINRKKEELTGQFYKQTLISPLSGKGEVPLRFATKRDGTKGPLPINIYGNYQGEDDAYYVNATLKKGKKVQTKLIGVPVMTAYKQKTDPNAITDYLIKKLSGCELLGYDKRIIYKYQLIRYDGHLCYVVSASELINAVQLVVDKKYNLMLYCLAHPDMVIDLKHTDRPTERISLRRSQELFEPLMKEFLLQYADKLERIYPLYNKIAKMVREYVVSDNFDKLPYIAEQDKQKGKNDFILDMLKISKAASSTLDMKGYTNFGGATSFSRLNGKTIYSDEVEWIDTSVTGFYRNSVPPKGDK